MKILDDQIKLNMLGKSEILGDTSILKFDNTTILCCVNLFPAKWVKGLSIENGSPNW